MVSREVLAACRGGDPTAFEEVVRATYRHVYTQALRLVGDRQEAEDVAQEAFLRVFRGLSGFRGDAQFETWLYRIVANTAMNHLRRRARFGELLAEPEDERLEPVAAHRPGEDGVDRARLSQGLASLADRMRAGGVVHEAGGPC